MTPELAAKEFWAINEACKNKEDLKAISSRVVHLGKIQSRFSPEQWTKYSIAFSALAGS
jgi:hypothetical protein